MADAKSIINLGLGKIAASRVSSISPPKSPLERHCADGYPVWRDSELELRDWRFAMEGGKQLTQSAILDNPSDGKKYKYALPNDYLRPLRSKTTEWEQRGSFLFSSYSALCIDYIKRVTESAFTNTFINVLACRVGIECVEFATQSNTKDDAIELKYDKAIKIAGRLNAYVAGPQDITLADENSEWIEARLGNFDG